MKTFLFLVFAAATSAFGADARSSFDAKNYADAAKQQELQVASAAPSAEGYYDLGLAEEKSGDVAQAALNYKRALLLDPGLRVARNALSTLAASHEIPLAPRSWRDDVTGVLHPDTLILAGNLILWAGAFGLLFSTQARRNKGAVIALSSFALAIGIAAQAAGWLSDARLGSARPAVVTAKDGAELLTEPASNSTPIITLHAGTPVGVLSPRGSWTYIDLNGGAKGWVQTDRLTPVVPSETL